MEIELGNHAAFVSNSHCIRAQHHLTDIMMPTLKTWIALGCWHTILLGAQAPALAGAQEPASALARLYAPQPPVGSSFVRAVNATQLPLRVAIGAGAPEQRLAPEGRIASAYKVVDASHALALSVNGLPAGKPLMLAPNTFVTIVIRADGHAHAHIHVLQTILDMPEKHDGLKAELRFYNLTPACIAQLNVADGPVVFEQVGAGQSRQRAINPVAATVIGHCGINARANAGSRLTLPPLKAADHYSVFLIGSNAVLAGQLAQTEFDQGAR